MTPPYRITNDGEFIKTFNERNNLHSYNDRPAVIDIRNGCCVWYHDGVLHRDDNHPAHVGPTGMTWMTQGVLHRTNGPAAIYSDGECEYYLEGKRFTVKENWEREVRLHKAQYQTIILDGKEYNLVPV